MHITEMTLDNFRSLKNVGLSIFKNFTKGDLNEFIYKEKICYPGDGKNIIGNENGIMLRAIGKIVEEFIEDRTKLVADDFQVEPFVEEIKKGNKKETINNSQAENYNFFENNNFPENNIFMKFDRNKYFEYFKEEAPQSFRGFEALISCHDKKYKICIYGNRVINVTDNPYELISIKKKFRKSENFEESLKECIALYNDQYARDSSYSTLYESEIK